MTIKSLEGLFYATPSIVNPVAHPNETYINFDLTDFNNKPLIGVIGVLQEINSKLEGATFLGIDEDGRFNVTEKKDTPIK